MNEGNNMHQSDQGPNQQQQQPQQYVPQQQFQQQQQPPQQQDYNAQQMQQQQPQQQQVLVVVQNTPNNNINEPPDEVQQNQAIIASNQSNQQPQKERVSDGASEFLDNSHIRALYMSVLFFWLSVLVLPLWTDPPSNMDDPGDGGFGLSATGAFLLLFGSIGAIIVTILDLIRILQTLGNVVEMILRIVVMVLWFLGGLFYWFGGCAMADYFNDYEFTGSDDQFYSAVGGARFGESLFVMIVAIIAGIDFFKRVLTNFRWRIHIYMITYILCAVILFFSYAIQSNRAEEIRGLDSDDGGPCAGVAVGYFVGGVVAVLFMVCALLPYIADRIAANIWMDIIFLIAFAISSFIGVVGYWAIAGNEDLRDAIFTGAVDDEDANAYLVAFSFWWVLYTFYLMLDIRIGKYIPFGKTPYKQKQPPPRQDEVNKDLNNNEDNQQMNQPPQQQQQQQQQQQYGV